MSVVIPFVRTDTVDPVSSAQPACAAGDADWWFDEAQYERGRQVCSTCPVQVRCLDEALASGERLGMWGGLTPAERAALPDAIVVPLRPRRWAR